MYTALRGIQRVFLDLWKEMPFSTMCDRSDDRIRQRLERVDKLLEPSVLDFIVEMKEEELGRTLTQAEREAVQPPRGFGDYISGDYDAATDSMHIDVTTFVLDRMLENLGYGPDSWIYRIAMRTMSGGKIVYPDGSSVLQTNGQLMGHPLSFPILCIINLSTYLRVRSKYTLDQVKDEPFLINGDDIVFRESRPWNGPNSDYNLWRFFAGEVGLIVNELKTYVHPKFNMINSIRHFHQKPIHYQNIALAIGHRVKSDPMRLLTASATIFEQLQATKVGAGHLCRDFLKTLGKRLPRRRLRLAGKEFVPNYFLPKAFGGLGLKNRSGYRYRITYPQRILAQYALRNPGKWIYQESYYELKTSSDLAIRSSRKLNPPGELWMIDGRPVEGPLHWSEDHRLICKDNLSRQCELTSYCINEKPIDENYVFRTNLKGAREVKEKPISSAKLRRLRYPRWRVPGPVQAGHGRVLPEPPTSAVVDT